MDMGDLRDTESPAFGEATAEEHENGGSGSGNG